ncbi:VWA domain-containing protein [Arenicella sp. 4NH20-0111]|uniref:vWA domain-containing protein n=1 Tax=Arenicella sp. 4NH20-0111 TaxID=3127648 RepID=UPI003342A486
MVIHRIATVIVALSSFVFSLDTSSSSIEPEAEQREQVMVVLDASGSMWGKIDNKPKIELVREAYGKLLVDWENMPVDAGLIIYGHRRKGDCSDIELISKPKPVNSISLEKTVNNISPKGKTPLGDAVRIAARQLKFTEKKATVVLLSDGVETCGVNSCELGDELEKLGVDFTTHVIGLDIKKDDDKQQLRCLAINTGGKYIDVTNAEGLGKALDIKSEIFIDTAEPNLQIVGLVDDLGEPAEQTSWRVTQGNQSFTTETSRSELHLKEWLGDKLIPGTYTLSAQANVYAGAITFNYPVYNDVLYLKLVRDVPKSDVIIKGDIFASSEFEVEWVGHGGKTDAIAIVKPGGIFNNHVGQADVSHGNRLTLTAPAQEGNYEVLYVFDAYGQARIDARVPISVQPTKLQLEVIGKIQAGGSFSVQWKGPGAPDDIIAIGPRTQKSDDHLYVNWVSEGNPLQITSPDEPGDYELRYYNDSYEILYSQDVIAEP